MSTSLQAQEESQSTTTSQDPWVVLVADDDEIVHLVTERVLQDLSFEQRPIRLVPTSSAAETRDYLARNDSVAVRLLDAVMETPSAGLDLVPEIRSRLRNQDLRIIVRTGQPGHKEPGSVIQDFDINGFARKEELGHQDLRDVVILGLRGYRDIIRARNRLT